MATIKFNYCDHFSEDIAKKMENEKSNHRQFKTTYIGQGNKLVSFSNAMLLKAEEIAEKNNCTLQNGCVSPIGAGWDFDKKGNIIGEATAQILVNYIFHGEKCYEAAQELDDFYKSIR